MIVTQLNFFKSLVNHTCVYIMDQITACIQSVQILRTHFMVFSVLSSTVLSHIIKGVEYVQSVIHVVSALYLCIGREC